MTDMKELATAAREHADNLAADISQAANRVEHIRLAQRALEASRIAEDLERLAE